jgi:hypothetical protein
MELGALSLLGVDDGLRHYVTRLDELKEEEGE